MMMMPNRAGVLTAALVTLNPCNGFSPLSSSSSSLSSRVAFPVAATGPVRLNHPRSSPRILLYSMVEDDQETAAIGLPPPSQNATGTSATEVEVSLSQEASTAAADEPEELTIMNGSTDMAESFSSENNSPYTLLKNTLFLGIDPSPDILAIVTIYFVEGALGLARLAQTFLLKDELHLGPAELSALTGLFVLPWTIKPLYGFLSDGFPLFGYKRRSYLVLAGLLGCASYTALGHDFWGVFGNAETSDTIMIQATVASLIVSSGCIAFSDVVADGIVVQKTRDSDDPAMAGGLQSLCWGSAALGGLLSAYYSGSLLEVMKPQDVFQLTAILPFLVACISLLIDEKPIGKKDTTQQSAMETTGDVATQVNGKNGAVNGNADDVDDAATNGELTTVLAANGNTATSVATQPPEDDAGVRGQIQALWDAFRQPSIWKPTLFLFLWQSTPTSDGAFLYFMTDELGFGPEFLGRVRLVTAGASLVGVWLYNRYLKTVPIKDILFWSSIIATPLGLSSLLLITHANRALGIPDAAFVFGDDVALAILGEIAFMPTLVLAARLCPPGVEAVLFATLMSIYNGAGTVGTEVGAVLTKWLGVTESNFDNLGLLTIICNVSSLYPLFLIGWLDEVGAASEKDEEDAAAAVAKLQGAEPQQSSSSSSSGSSQ